MIEVKNYLDADEVASISIDGILLILALQSHIASPEHLAIQILQFKSKISLLVMSSLIVSCPSEYEQSPVRVVSRCCR